MPNSPSIINDEMSFLELCEVLKAYFVEFLDQPQPFTSLKHSPVVTNLANQLAEKSHNPATVAALLWCKAQFTSEIDEDDKGYGLGGTRALACEVVAMDLVSSLSARDALDYLCYELPLVKDDDGDVERVTETTELLTPGRGGRTNSGGDIEADSIASYAGLNTLEIAILADAKKFLSHRPVQRMVNEMKSDPFCRLRVPKYQKAFEALFLAIFLALYYAVLIERNPKRVTGAEACFIVFLISFAVDEFSSIRDAGTSLYAADFWSWLDMCVVLIGVAFLGCRIAGLVKDSDELVDTSFDILSLEAVFLVPRMCSLLSLNPYFGVLIPCLKQMAKDFMKFLILVAIIYLGFLTTFSLLARDSFTVTQMSWMLVKVFFGSPSIGFDAMREISPVLGPPLMLIFVTFTNILLITSLISLLSNSLTNMMNNARFSIMVLEASTSNRLVVFYPPLNLLPLILLRPLRLILPAGRLRGFRIALLKISHFPFAAAIMAFEFLWPETETRHTAWGPSPVLKKTGAGGLRTFGRRPDRCGEWSGRLTGTKLGLGGLGMQPVPAPMSGASSIRLDERHEEEAALEQQRMQHSQHCEDHIAELKRIRQTMEELSRKVDKILAQGSRTCMNLGMAEWGCIDARRETLTALFDLKATHTNRAEASWLGCAVDYFGWLSLLGLAQLADEADRPNRCG
ncbi:hypothetical protein RUND412_001748 [Rhizina undulata]